MPLQTFTKPPGARIDYSVQMAVGDSHIDGAAEVVILDCRGDAVAAGNTAAPTIVAESVAVAGAVVHVRIAGGKRDTEWYIRVRVNLADGQIKEKHAPLYIRFPIESEADTSVVQMGAADTVSQTQLAAAVRAETLLRTAADAAQDERIAANTAHRIDGVSVEGRVVTFALPDGGEERLELPNAVTGLAIADRILTATYIDGSTEEIELPAGGDGGGQTAEQVRDAIREAVNALVIPPPLATFVPLWGAQAGANAPVAPVIPLNKLLPAGAGFVADNAIVGIWRQERFAPAPGETLWMSLVIIFANNATLVSPPIAVNELSAADRDTLASIADLARRVGQNDAKRGAAIWAQDRGDGGLTISDSAVPRSITRDSEVSEVFIGAAFADGVLTLTRKDGNNPLQLNLSALMDGAGLTEEQVDNRIKPFARSGGDVLILEADLAPAVVAKLNAMGGAGSPNVGARLVVAAAAGGETLQFPADIGDYDLVLVHVTEGGEQRVGVLSAKGDLAASFARRRFSGTSDAIYDLATRTLSRADSGNSDLVFVSAELYQINGVSEPQLNAALATRDGLLNLLGEADNSLAAAIAGKQSASPALTELARATVTHDDNATWRQNAEGHRTYGAPLTRAFAKAFGEDIRTDSADIFAPDAALGALILPAAARRVVFANPGSQANGLPGIRSYYTDAVGVSGMDAASEAARARLIVAFTYSMKFEIASDGVRRPLLNTRNAAGAQVANIIDFLDGNLIVRRADAGGATSRRERSWQSGLVTTQGESHPFGLNNQPLLFRVPAGIAAGSAIGVTVHADIEGVDSGDPVVDIVNPNWDADLAASNRVWNIPNINNPAATVSYDAATRILRVLPTANFAHNDVENFNISATYTRTESWNQPTSHSDFWLSAGDDHDRFGLENDALDSTRHPRRRLDVFAVFEPLREGSDQVAVRLWINGHPNNGGHPIDLARRVSEIFPAGWRLYVGGAEYNVGRLTGDRYSPGEAPTNAQALAMHLAHRGGDVGLGAFRKAADAPEVSLPFRLTATDRDGNKAGMFYISERLNAVGLDDLNEGDDPIKINLTDAESVLVGVAPEVAGGGGGGGGGGWFEIPIDEISATSFTHRFSAQNVRVEFSFPTNSADANATFALDGVAGLIGSNKIWLRKKVRAR